MNTEPDISLWAVVRISNFALFITLMLDLPQVLMCVKLISSMNVNESTVLPYFINHTSPFVTLRHYDPLNLIKLFSYANAT